MALTAAARNADEGGSAIAELRRALAAAESYLEASAPPIHLDSARIDRFLRWSREERHNSPNYLREQRAYLGWWATRLSGVDVREMQIARDVLPHLDELAGGRAPRIAVLKVFCSWLHRHRHELDRDPLAALKVPQPRPAQWKRRRIVAREDLEGARGELPAWAADAVLVLLGTGWHVSELARFAAAGEISRPPRRTKSAGVLETTHKHGEIWRTPVSRQVLAAARRIRARGKLDYFALRKAIRGTCDRAGVPRWTPGRLRHTVATHAVHQGESLQRVAEFLGHRDARTTRRFYVDVFVPRRVKTPA